MKKKYIKPGLVVVELQTMLLQTLSVKDDTVDSFDVLLSRRKYFDDEDDFEEEDDD